MLIIAAFTKAHELDSTEAPTPDEAAEETNEVDHLENEDSATFHAATFAMWAWGVKAGSVTDSTLDLEPDDDELNGYSIDRHRDCILPGSSRASGSHGALTNDVMKLLSENIEKQSNSLNTMNELNKKEIQRKITKDNNKNNRVQDLHPSVTNMLLMASAISCDVAPTELVESCTRFLNQKNSGLAETELLTQFHELGMRDIYFGPGVSLALYAGDLLFKYMGRPCNFSAFCFFPQTGNEDEDDIDKRAILLHIMKEQGRGKTYDEVKKSTKQTVRTPNDIPTLIKQLGFFRGASSILLGIESLLTVNLIALELAINQNVSHFNRKTWNNPSFSTQFLYAVNVRVQRWLSLCRMAKGRDEVDDSIINFDHLIDQILYGYFHMDLPSSFKLPDDNNDSGPPTKHQRSNKNNKDHASSQDNRAVKNESQIEDIKLRPGKSWKDFCGAHVAHCPKWNDKVAMCARYHIKGDCFQDCKNAASHVPKEHIPADNETGMRQYVQKVRGE